MDTIRNAGYPVTLRELDQWYPQAPETNNSADVFGAAFRKLSRGKDPAPLSYTHRIEPPLDSAPFPERLETGDLSLLASNEEAMALLHDGVSIKRSRYPLDLSHLSLLPYPHLLQLQRSAYLLELEAVDFSDEQNPELAVRSVRSLLSLADSLEAEPLVRSHLARMECQRTAVSSLMSVLNKNSLSDSDLSSLSAGPEPGRQPAVPGPGVCRPALHRDLRVQFDGRYDGLLRVASESAADLVAKHFRADESAADFLETTSIIRPAWSVGMNCGIWIFSATTSRPPRKTFPNGWPKPGQLDTAVRGLPRYLHAFQTMAPGHERDPIDCPRRGDRRTIAGRPQRHCCGAVSARVWQTARDVVRFDSDLFEQAPEGSLRPESVSLRYRKLSKGYEIFSLGEGGRADSDYTNAVRFVVER